MKSLDKYYLKKYGIDDAEYNRILEEQHGVCKICGKPPKKNRLSVDHDHRYHKVKIVVQKMDNIFGLPPCYEAFALGHNYYHEDKKIAREQVRQWLKQQSIRGLLCVWCNRGLQKYHDNPKLFRNAAKYLEDYLERSVLDVKNDS